MTTLNSAIVGCGAISSTHGDAILRCKKAKLYAVCDIDRARLLAAADRYHCKSFADYHEMLSDESIDVVHLCTPHYLHAPMAISAMKAGKDVIVEKPMAISVPDAQEMINVSGQTGKRLGVCFQNRYNTTSLKLKEVLASGKAGKVLGGKAFITWRRDAAYYAKDAWRGTWDREGGGVLINQAIHTLDLLQWYMGEVEQIKASIATRLLDGVIEVEDTAEATIKFKNGAVVLFYATNCYCVDSPVEIELICEKATIRWKDDLTIQYKNGETEHQTNVDKATGEKAYWGGGHKLLIEDFYDKLAGGQSFELDGAQGIKAVEIVSAIYKSSQVKK